MEEISTGTEDASEMESQPPAKGDGINYTPDLPDEIQEQAALLEEIRTLLKEVPYTAFIDGHYKSQSYPYITDEVGKELADFLSGIMFFNGISSLEEVDDQFVLRASIHATARLQGFAEKGENYHPELAYLQPLFDLHPGYFEVIPKHHVEITAKRLFGDNISISDYSLGSGRMYLFYLEEVEAYVIYGFGAPVSTVPIILSYTESTDHYEAVVVFVNHSDNGFVMDGKMDVLSEEQLIDYIETKQKYRIQIGKKLMVIYTIHPMRPTLRRQPNPYRKHSRHQVRIWQRSITTI